GEDRLCGNAFGIQSRYVGQYAVVQGDRDTAGQFLALLVTGQQDRGRRFRGDERGKRVSLRRHEVLVEHLVFGGIDLRGAVLGEVVGGRGRGARCAQHHVRDVSQAPGQGEHLVCQLVRLRSDDEYFSHLGSPS